jgi:hypothetical protein
VFHMVIIWSTLFGRRIRWRGRVYRVDAPQRVHILEEPARSPGP